jgi:hypothetical protein
LLGVAAMRYSDNDINEYREFLKEFPPYILTSRDSDTYNLLGDLAEHSIDGIDMAFFIPDLYQLGGLKNLPPFIALSFDKTPEPVFQILTKNSSNPNLNFDRFFYFGEEKWVVKSPALRVRLARKSRYLMLLESILFPGNKNSRIGNYLAVRTDHRYNPIIKKKTFRYPNTMVNDTPYPYFEIYGNAELTLSNRLHACVIALAYGKPAMLFSESPRLRLMERLNLTEVTKCPVTIDQHVLDTEKRKLVNFLYEWMV